MPPFDPIGSENHMQQQITRYMRKAGIDQRGRKHSGFHSLRHSAGSMLLEICFHAVIQETKVADLVEIKGKHIHQIAPDEFRIIQGDLAFRVTGIFPSGGKGTLVV